MSSAGGAVGPAGTAGLVMSTLGTEVARLARDRLALDRLARGRAAHCLVRGRASAAGEGASPPAAIDAVTAPWLSAVTGHAVRAVHRGDLLVGTTMRARVDVDGDGLPPSLFVKLAPRRLGVRVFVDLVGLGRNEVAFYRSLAAAVPLRVPACFGAVSDPRSGRFALVLDDLEAHGCAFADVTAPVEAERARTVVAALARLHGRFWARTSTPSELDGLAAADAGATWLTAWLVVRALRSVARRFPDDIPAGCEADLAWLADHHPAVTARLEQGPHTLLHGDPHLGNIAFDEKGPIFFDWQVARAGPAFRDLSYFLVLSLDPAVLVEHEGALVGLYADELADAGGPRLGREVAWDQYRVHVADPLVAAAFTAVAGGLQARVVATTGLRRAAAAARRLGTVDQLRAGGPPSLAPLR